MIQSYDVGSLPLRVDESIIKEGAKRSLTLLPILRIAEEDAVNVFEEEVVSAYVDKINMGIDVPNYPQFRDMNEMFFEMIRGIEKSDAGYKVYRTVGVKPSSSIPEVDLLKRNVSRIRDLTGVDKVRVKACVTGPYTLASFFQEKSPKLFENLGRSLAKIVSRSIFQTRHGGLAILCIDEPVLGFLNDPLLDYGSEGREALRRAWDGICRAATSKGVKTGMHLHDTSDDLFWEVEHLDIVESHFEDPLYVRETTKRRLRETDKCLKASIAVTIFENLIESSLRRGGLESNIQQKVGEVWTDMRFGRKDPLTFIEDLILLRKRLMAIVERFGAERVPYAGPECGLGGWPTYESAMECLRRVSESIKKFNEKKLKGSKTVV
jgi:5-methyltetrahydropteroyltriglutamate--homocysteine methyltransferase